MSAILSAGELKFRTMLEDDLDQIMDIEQSAYAHCWTRGIFRDCLRVGYYAQVIEQDDEIQGYAVMSESASEAHILNICVRPSSQRQGIGKMLVEHLIGVAKRMGNNIMLLEVRPSNQAAIGLYQKLGFFEVGCRKGYYPDKNGREDALILALNL
jgi:ribosomal-protein-alanine N-acetyltransferase